MDSMIGAVANRVTLSWYAAASDPHSSSTASLTQSRYVFMYLESEFIFSLVCFSWTQVWVFSFYFKF